MYQMLTVQLPLKADTPMEMLVAHIHRLPKPIREARPDLEIPDAIATPVMRTLEKKRELRPSSAEALIEEIQRAEEELPQNGRHASAFATSSGLARGGAGESGVRTIGA